jgi:hypothetical protein
MTRAVGFVACLAFLGSGQGVPSASNEIRNELIAHIRANSQTVHLRGGALEGPGAERILQQGRAAQFVVLAEEHYVREIPEITTALLRQLQPAGFNYLAIESATAQAQLASQPPLRGDRDRLREFTRLYPFSLTFFSDQEAQMIADAGAISRGKGNPVWGIDQEFGVTHVLERIAPHAASQRARDVTRKLLERARAQETAARRADFDEQSHFIISGVTPAELAALRELYAAVEDPRVKHLVEALVASSTIYNHYIERRYYLNSSVRERYMKEVFVSEYRRAESRDGEAPRVILKAGHWHALRGMNDAGVFTLGNLLSELAQVNGRESFHISVHVHGPENHWRGIGKWDETRLFAEATAEDRFTFVDLRPMRQLVNRKAVREALPPATRRPFFEADGVLILGGAQPATTSWLEGTVAPGT